MSFYLDDDVEDLRYSLGGGGGLSQKSNPNDEYSENGGGADNFVCDNCGSTDCYMDETSGGLVCVDCHTQSQTILAASQTEIDYDDTMLLAGRVSGGRGHFKTAARTGPRLKRKRKTLEELDQSTTLPNTEQCIIGFQRILHEICKQVAGFLMKDCPRKVRKAAMGHCRRIWSGYLEAWMAGADFFGKLYPEIRLSIRDCFLTVDLRSKVRRTLEYKAKQQVRQEVAGRQQDIPTATSTSNTNKDSPLKLDEDMSNRYKDGEDAVPLEFIGNDPADIPDEHSIGASLSLGLDDGETVNTFLGSVQPKGPRRLNEIHRMILHHQKLVKSKTLGRRATALSLFPSLQMAAAIIVMAYSPYGVTCENMRQWIMDGRVPLLYAFPLLTTQERKQLNLIGPFFRMTEPPAATYLNNMVRCLQVASGYIPKNVVIKKKSRSEPTSSATVDAAVAVAGPLPDPPREIFRQFSPRSLPLVLARAIAELGLSQDVLNYSFALMGLPICKDMLKKSKGRKIQWLPKTLQTCRQDKVPTISELAGVIITACQFVPSWEEHWYVSSSTNDQHQSIPWNESASQKIHPASIKPYLKLIEDNFLVTEESLLLNDEEEIARSKATTEIRMDDSSFPSNNDAMSNDPIIQPSSTVLRPRKLPSHSRQVLSRGSVIVKDDLSETALKSTAPLQPIGALIEFVSVKLGANPRRVIQFCEELAEEMRYRQERRKQRRTAKRKRKDRLIVAAEDTGASLFV